MGYVTARAPFDTERLDALLEDAGIDVLVATSKHNVQYFMGGYRFFFFDTLEAIGVSRYLPVFVYHKGDPQNAAYIGNQLETQERELGRLWAPHVTTSTWGSVDAIAEAVDHILAIGGKRRRIGLEFAFIPHDAAEELKKRLPGCDLVDAHFALERLRAVKQPYEIAMLREASERVVASMLSTFAAAAPGQTKQDLVQRLRTEEASRGLGFEYCLITSGTNLNRSPSPRRLEPGDIISLDSGANFHGYVGDLCRMGILGEPDSELQDILAEVEEVQDHARRPVRPGTRGGEIYAAAEAVIRTCNHAPYTEFIAHGMGLIAHEAPRLTSYGPVPYEGYDQDRPLESGMVISIETTIKHPSRGFIKLEDTVLVTGTGCEGLGNSGRGWNRAEQSSGRSVAKELPPAVPV